MTDDPSRPRTRLLLFQGIVLVVALLGSLLIAEIVLLFLQRPEYDEGRMDPGLIVYDSRLGWKLQSGWTGSHVHEDFSARYTVDARGFRSTGQPSRPGRTPVLVLGDSFTFAVGVSDADTFCGVLDRIYDNINVVNGGIIGYSTDQEVLFLEEYRRIRKTAGTVLVTFLSNDLIDNALAYPLQAVQAKPYFKVQSGRLVLEHVPVPRTTKPPDQPRSFTEITLDGVYARGAWTRMIDRTALGNRMIQLKNKVLGYRRLDFTGKFAEELDLYARLVERATEVSGATPRKPLILVLLPGQSYVENPGSFSAQYQEYIRGRIRALPFSERIRVLDLALPLRQAHATGEGPFYFPNEGHLNVEGNRWVAERLAGELAVFAGE